MVDRIGYERRDEWVSDLNAPLRRVDSDKVSQAEVDEEMALFSQAQGTLR